MKPYTDLWDDIKQEARTNLLINPGVMRDLRRLRDAVFSFTALALFAITMFLTGAYLLVLDGEYANLAIIPYISVMHTLWLLVISGER